MFEQIKRMDKPKNKIKLVCGWGINDVDYPVRLKEKYLNEDGDVKLKSWICPKYSIWYDMISRCYGDYAKKNLKTYTDCTVNEEWKNLSNFCEWYDLNYVSGWDLDKDILIPGNKEYSSKTCAFVPHYLNTVLIDSGATRGEWPLGVTKYAEGKGRKKLFQMQMRNKDNTKKVSYHATSEEAHKAWQEAKAQKLEDILLRYSAEPLGFRTDVAESLALKIWRLKLHSSTGIETIKL